MVQIHLPLCDVVDRVSESVGDAGSSVLGWHPGDFEHSTVESFSSAALAATVHSVSATAVGVSLQLPGSASNLMLILPDLRQHPIGGRTGTKY